MSLRIQNQGQPELEASASAKSTSTLSATNRAASQDTSIDGVRSDQDTASISAVTSQLSTDTPIRQDRVDALRMQVENGTYTIDAHAVASAMFQNLTRS